MKPNNDKPFDEKKHSHFEPIPDMDICTSPEHMPPTHLWIPAGQQYIHICPQCGFRMVIRSPQITC